jgi:hypothetical protein
MYHHLLNKLTDWQPEWKDHTLKNTLLMVALILDQKTVNLWKLKGSVGKLLGNTQTDSRSHYQRLKRWLWQGAGEKRLWVQILLAAHRVLTKKTSILIVDGTSWQSAGMCYHFLTLSVLYRGVSVPLFWIDLDRLGASSQWHRKLLLKTALTLLDLKGKTLLGDREYVGTEWFKCLIDNGLDFVIRLRVNDYEQALNQRGKSVTKLETRAKARLKQAFSKRFELEAHPYTYVVMAYRNRSRKIEYLRLITTLSPAKAMEAYSQRYRIETMFKHLKSNGFDLESLNVRYPYKVQLLMAVVVLAYSLAVVYGLVGFKTRMGTKRYGSKLSNKETQSPEMSVFRFGLDKWQNHLRSLTHFCDQLSRYFNRWKIAFFDAKLGHVP